MKYLDNDLENIIALCEQGENNKIADNLSQRCKKALAYSDISLRITKKDRQFLSSLYDENMDEDAINTLKRIIKN